MRIVVFGAGALGSFLGALLCAHHDVVLVGRKAHVEAIQRDGLRVTGKTELHVHPSAAESLAGLEAPDLVLVTVKAYDTAAAGETLRPWSDGTLFLSVQNGLGNLETLGSVLPRVLGGLTSGGVTFVGPGHVEHAGEGDIVVGPFHGTTKEDARRVADLFAPAGLEAHTTDDIVAEAWAKVIVNAGINPLTALAGVRNGVLLDVPELKAMMEAACREAARVAESEGIHLPPGDPVARAQEVARRTADNKSSMLQDIERGRRTEIDAINGAIAAAGERHGIPTPVNAALAALVRGVEAARRQR